MSVFNNPNFISFSGEPITGRMPTKTVVYGPQMTGPQQAGVAHAYKLFCDAVNTSVGKYVVQNRVLADGTKVRMISNWGNDTVMVWTTGGGGEEHLGYWASYTLIDLVVPDTEIAPDTTYTFDVVKFNGSLSAAKRILRRVIKTTHPTFSLTVECSAVVGNIVYWTTRDHVDISNTPTSSGAASQIGTNVTSEKLTLYRSEGTNDEELGYLKKTTTYTIDYQNWGTITAREVVIDVSIQFTQEGVLGVEATPWGMLVKDQYDPGGWGHPWGATSGALMNGQATSGRRAYYAQPKTLEPITALPEGAYAVAWGDVDFPVSPPLVNTAYSEEQVKAHLAEFNWGVYQSFYPILSPWNDDAYQYSRPDWIPGGYTSFRYYGSPAKVHISLFKFGEAYAYKWVDISHLLGEYGFTPSYLSRGLWTETFGAACLSRAGGLTLCLRKYSSMDKEAQLLLVPNAEIPPAQNAYGTSMSVRLGRDALDIYHP